MKKAALSEDERKSAMELELVKNRPEITKDAYPVCKPPDHEPDINVGHLKNSNQYRLYCEECGKRGPALPHKQLSKAEKDNAMELIPQSN